MRRRPAGSCQVLLDPAAREVCPHIFSTGFTPKDTKTVGNDNRDGTNQCEFGAGRLRVLFLDEAKLGLGIAPVPQRMEL
jgi:hypothetical protein